MGQSSYANLEVREGTVTSEITLTFNLKPRVIVITNDSVINDMTFKFTASGTPGTLKPTETIRLDFASKTVIIDSTSADYRVWGIG